ncbi:MAG: hypothetical protein LKCHEGNO_02365 [Burkholderiaceae bacterium]|nr:hypothetical protein [Burkholderiaceae bacterium]
MSSRRGVRRQALTSLVLRLNTVCRYSYSIEPFCHGQRRRRRRGRARGRPARLCRAALPQQLHFPDRGFASRGAGRARARTRLHGAGDHRRVLAGRRGARTRRGQTARSAPDRRRRDAAGAGAGQRAAGPAAGAAGAIAPRLRQPRAVDHRGAPPRRQGQLRRVGQRYRGPRAARAVPGGPARLLCVDGGRPGAAVSGAVRARDVAQDLVRPRSRGARGRTAAPRARRAARRGRRAAERAHRPAARGCRRRADARARAQAAARRAHRHAARQAGGRMRLRARAQCRGAPAVAPAAGGAVPGRLAGGHGAHRCGLRVLARRAALRVPAGDRARGPHPHELAARARRGWCAQALRRWRAAQGAARHRARTRADRAAALRAVLPHRGRRGELGQAAGHPVPGPRQRGQLGGLLLPGHHRGRPGAQRAAVRALRQRRAQRAARHRRRLRAPAPRGGDPVPLPQVRPPPRRTDRGGDQLPAAFGAARHRPCAGAGPRLHRRGGARPALVRRQASARRSPARGRPRPRLTDLQVVARADNHADRLPASPEPAPGRLRDRARRRVAPGAGGERRDGRAHRDPVGQGRPRHARPDQGRRAGAGHAERDQARARVHRAEEASARVPPAGRAHPRRHDGRRQGGVRHARRRRFGGRVPGREPRADEHAAAAEAQELLRPGDRGGDRAPRADPGWHGPSVPAAAQRRRGGRLPERRGEAGAAAHARRADLPGAGDAARDPGGRLHARRGRRVAPRDGGLEAQGRPRAVPRAAGGPHDREGLHARVCRAHLRADRGLRRVRLPREPRRQLRAAGVRERVDQAPPPRRVPGRAAEQPADGLLRAGATGARRARTRRAGAAGRRAGESVGQRARAW